MPNKKHQQNHQLNGTSIDTERDNNFIVSENDLSTIATTTEEEKPIKNDSIIRTDIDYKKIQSDTKDIEIESTDNILQLRRIVTSTTTQPAPRSTQPNVFSNSGGNGGTLDNVQTLSADSVIRRRHRRRRQGR